MSILIINQQNKYRVPKKFIEVIAPKIIRILGTKRIISSKKIKLELSFVFVTSKQIQDLNRNFRNKNKPTDILSFNSLDPSLLGELILCPEIITKNAKTNQWPHKYEYLYMLIHGLLHLLGYDHESEVDSKKMFKLQDQIFNLISDGPKVSG